MATLYPDIQIDRNKKPSKFYALPLLGFFLKLLMVFPVEIELFFLKFAQWIFSMCNSFSIFFNGKYWKTAYELNLGIMRLETNVSYFIWGLTDKYPGFALQTTNYDLTISYNKKPSRALATPLLGMLFRFGMMIPYLMYRHVLSLAATLAIMVGWIPVLSKGRFPETVYEIARDSVRVDQAATAYFLGLSDEYPSWWISMKHKALKILLLVIAIIITFWSFTGHWDSGQSKQMQNKYFMNTVQKAPSTVTY